MLINPFGWLFGYCMTKGANALFEKDLNDKLCETVAEWMVDVPEEFKCFPKTLFPEIVGDGILDISERPVLEELREALNGDGIPASS